MVKVNSSLVNPKLDDSGWSVEEKRKCALLVRGYSCEENPVLAAAKSGLIERRSSKSVSERWKKVLDPSLTPESVGRHDREVRRGGMARTSRSASKAYKKEFTEEAV